MGCDCCKIGNPEHYAKCKVAQGTNNPRKVYYAPCGMDFGGDDYGCNNTPPKKKRKRINRKHRRQ